ncbi:hypothetical protein PSPO01_05772 [Paraphaeosphaeria sporulosa]
MGCPDVLTLLWLCELFASYFGWLCKAVVVKIDNFHLNWQSWNYGTPACVLNGYPSYTRQMLVVAVNFTKSRLQSVLQDCYTPLWTADEEVQSSALGASLPCTVVDSASLSTAAGAATVINDKRQVAALRALLRARNVNSADVKQIQLRRTWPRGHRVACSQLTGLGSLNQYV